MKLRHLRTFVAVADERGFSRASRRLNVSQPALSRHVRDLEREIGVLLFERESRHVELTYNGRRLLECARRLMAAHDRFIDCARRARMHQAGAIGSGSSSGLSPAITLVERAHARRCPDVDIRREDLPPRARDRHESDQSDTPISSGAVSHGLMSDISGGDSTRQGGSLDTVPTARL
jgi:DNA-binding transcriptional LysR family regulator